ncbi:hypothetical protein G7046_g886 [Stylonectria norvegica]|nr:hypothetical protein G7046_g886 [Stylonectria norvegica]
MDRYRLLEDHRPESVTSWTCHQECNLGYYKFTFNFCNLVLHLEISSEYQEMTLCQILDINRLYSRRRLDPVREEVRQMLQPVFSTSTSRVKEFDLEVAILQALERIAELEETPDRNASPDGPADGPGEKSGKGWAADGINDWTDILENPYGLDVSTIRDTASEIIGKTPGELVRDIPDSWRVIHMESVLRPDFVHRFQQYQQNLLSIMEREHRDRLKQRLPPHSALEGHVRATLRGDQIIDDMIKPRITFHGTQLKSVSSIVRYGFKMPGRFIEGNQIVSPRSGIAFNRGIYSSQAPAYAMSYAAGGSTLTPVGHLPTMRLFVCATIMGRTYRGQDKRQSVHGPLVSGYDSHFDGGFEYIVHDERAMLPCYVIHLDLGSDEAKAALRDAQRNPEIFNRNQTKRRKDRSLLLDKTRKMAPGDVKRDKEAKKAAAMKWFPYGFGPATGTTFVIEEVGEISDDEEEYGDWQADKHSFANEYQKEIEASRDNLYDEWDEDGNPTKTKKGLFLDQYQHVLRQA